MKCFLKRKPILFYFLKLYRQKYADCLNAVVASMSINPHRPYVIIPFSYEADLFMRLFVTNSLLHWGNTAVNALPLPPCASNLSPPVFLLVPEMEDSILKIQ
jgi:hypothetical protein